MKPSGAGWAGGVTRERLGNIKIYTYDKLRPRGRVENATNAIPKSEALFQAERF